jgi:hypothetical protein
MCNPVHHIAFDRVFHPLYAIVRFILDPALDGSGTDWEEVHMDAAANHSTRLRLPTGSGYLLRRFKDEIDMHIGSYNIYAYCESRKEAIGSASTRTRC